MNSLIKSATIIDKNSEFHNKSVDILIKNGIISDIAENIKNSKNYSEISFPNLHVSNGWFDYSVCSGEPGYEEASEFAATVCPVGSDAIFVQDSWQIVDKYDRSLGLVYCNDMMLNEMLLSSGHSEIFEIYCNESEFGSQDWAIKYGCS